jgi:hypothetical protein
MKANIKLTAKVGRKSHSIFECPLELLREAEIRLGHTPLIGLSVEKNRCWSLYFVISSLKKNGMGLFSMLMMDQCLSVEDLEFDVGPFESYEGYSNLGLVRDEEDYIFGSLVDDPLKIVLFRNANFRKGSL